MKQAHALDIVVEFAFGLAAGCALFFFLAANGAVALPMNPFASAGVALGLLQAAVDTLRGRGWRYSCACAVALGVGVFAGGYLALAGSVLYWTAFRKEF